MRLNVVAVVERREGSAACNHGLLRLPLEGATQKTAGGGKGGGGGVKRCHGGSLAMSAGYSTTFPKSTTGNGSAISSSTTIDSLMSRNAYSYLIYRL